MRDLITSVGTRIRHATFVVRVQILVSRDLEITNIKLTTSPHDADIRWETGSHPGFTLIFLFRVSYVVKKAAAE